MLNYSITPKPFAHQWHITLSYEHIAGEPHILKLANWVAGSYMIRDFSRHIIHIQARHNDQIINPTQIDKNTWHLPATGGMYQIDYIVYANDLSVRASLLDNERGFIDGACLFLYQPNRQMENCRIEWINLPQNWTIQTTLPQIEPHVFTAKDYATLIDHPFEMGEHIEILQFSAHGIPHRIALSGHYPEFDRQRLIKDCQRICEYEINLFAQQPPFQEYLFLLHLGDKIYGGLEHLNSTALHADRHSLPPFGIQEANLEYTQLLGLIAHEYFHAWNVKSIKPSAFLPYQFDQETYTEQLWAYEGITSYYDDLTLVRCGAIGVSHYLTLLMQNITRVHRHAGRKWQTLAQSSFCAWHKYYKQDENSPNAITSYYQQGALFALCLDLTIRGQTTYSLNTVMQKLYQRFRQTQQGTAEGQWQILAQEYIGISLADFFAQALYTTDDLPLEQCLAIAGIQLRWFPQNQQNLGALVEEWPDSNPQAELGCRFKQYGDHAILSHVFSGSSIENAALKPNDKIVAIDGFACIDFLTQAQTQIGDTHTIHYFRQGVLQHTQLTVQACNTQTAYCKIVDENALQRWLFHT